MIWRANWIFGLIFWVLESCSRKFFHSWIFSALNGKLFISIFIYFSFLNIQMWPFAIDFGYKPFLFGCLWGQHLRYDSMTCTVFAFFSCQFMIVIYWLKLLAFWRRFVPFIAMFNARKFSFLCDSFYLLIEFDSPFFFLLI